MVVDCVELFPENWRSVYCLVLAKRRAVLFPKAATRNTMSKRVLAHQEWQGYQPLDQGLNKK